MSYEETLERKVIGAISGFKNNTKTAKEVTVAIELLSAKNKLLAEDYQKKFVEAAREKSAKK